MEDSEEYQNHRLEPDEVPMKVFSHAEYLESHMDHAQYRAYTDEKFLKMKTTYDKLLEAKDLLIEVLLLENGNLKSENERLKYELQSYKN